MQITFPKNFLFSELEGKKFVPIDLIGSTFDLTEKNKDVIKNSLLEKIGQQKTLKDLINDKNIKFISFGLSYSLIVISKENSQEKTSDEIFSVSNKNNFQKQVLNLPNSQLIKAVSAGKNNFIVLSQNKENSNQKIYTVDLEKNALFKEVKTLSRKIECIACGWDHYSFVSARGEVFTWGKGLYGALGHSNVLDLSSPKKIDYLDGIFVKAVDCGIWHTVVLSRSGALYSFGSNRDGQLGLRKEQSLFYRPELVEFSEENLDVESVLCGARFSAALTKNGDVYKWGWDALDNLDRLDFGGLVDLAVGSNNNEERSGTGRVKYKKVSYINSSHWGLSLIK